MSDPDCLGAPKGGDVKATLRVVNELMRRGIAAQDLANELFDQAQCILQSLIEHDKLESFSFGHPGPRLLTPGAAYRLEITRNPDGSSMVAIDDVKPFRLPRGLTDFLEKLAADGDNSDDALVPWKSRASLRAWFEKQSGKGERAKFVNNRVNLLRCHLREAGVRREVVHTDDVRGVRFALRRSSRTSPREGAGE
jgi:hypothetical protein